MILSTCSLLSLRCKQSLGFYSIPLLLSIPILLCAQTLPPYSILCHTLTLPLHTPCGLARAARKLPQHCAAESLCYSTLPNGLNVVSSHSPSHHWMTVGPTWSVATYPPPLPPVSEPSALPPLSWKANHSILPEVTNSTIHVFEIWLSPRLLLRKTVRNNLSAVTVGNLGKRASFKKIKKIIKEP